MYPDVVTARKNSDASVPLTATQAEVLNKLLNPAGTLFAVGERLAALEAKVAGLTIVSFDAQGGTPVVISPVVAAVGATYGSVFPADPTKAGFAFEGWGVVPGAIPANRIDTDSLITDSQSHTLYAIWGPP